MCARRRNGQSRRGRDGCRALVFAVVLALLAGGCGDGGSDSPDESEKASDVALLNEALALELTSIDAYESGLALLRGPYSSLGREFHAHDQEHADALMKTIRGLGGEVDAEASELERPGPRDQAEFLALAYERENAAYSSYIDVVPEMATDAPRTLAAALAASHAQRLVVLRRGLGADLASTVPEAFEPGDLPPPGEPGAESTPEGP
jgi:bacterioferritin (cytochrome b1)